MAAAVAAGTANAARNERRRVAEDAPLPESVRQALLVGPVRLTLGAAGLAAAVALDLAFGTALAAAAVGAVLTTFTLVAPRGRQRPWRLRPATEPGPRTWPVSLAVAMFPSTYVVAVLTAIALAFDRVLAALLSGVLLAMGVLALVYAVSRRP